MNIIIPLGGKGERFINGGYTVPKPLIKIFDKPMIEYVIDNIKLTEDDIVFIIYNYGLDNYDFSSIINNKYKNIHLIKINDTRGSVETLYLGINDIFNNYKYNKKSLILDCDTFYTEDIVSIFRNSDKNMVYYTKNYEENPIYSYIGLDNKSNILNIKEKEKISDNANTGAYAFIDIKMLYEYCLYVLNNNITFKNEPYTSCVISEMIKDNIEFIGHQLTGEYVISLGTPNAVEDYIKKTHAFLFDLDGTLVLTDEIYINVWRDILYKYNIVLTPELFQTYIQGNNDKYVCNTLLKNINIDIIELSNLKDMLFIENIDKLKVIDGVYDIIKQIKKNGHKLAIVTNCNRIVAEAIIKYIHIDNTIDFIISSNDCVNGKPNSEPYSKAITKYNIKNDKCLIFEDSKAGITSGKSCNPKLLIGIETIYSHQELRTNGANFTYKNYLGINIYNLLDLENNTKQLTEQIISSCNKYYNIKNISLEVNKLKGGFIADVIGFKLHTLNNETHSLILKYENKEENNLSLMARQLELYNREYYFYTNISNEININIPKYVCLINDIEVNPIGIIMENLIDKNYKINLNLNVENIDVSLKIIDAMAKMHSKFWNTNVKEKFPKLKNSCDKAFCPFLKEFINSKYDIFKVKWNKILSPCQINKCDEIYKKFSDIQERFSIGNNLTFIHGDIKSPNIFYDIENHYEPYFIDWQHCAIGKGVQDLIFFIIESFDIVNINIIYNLAINYYYKKLMEYGVKNYSYEEYKRDLYDAICYIPFFTAIWFGSIPQDELIDPNFPFFLISKMFYLLSEL